MSELLVLGAVGVDTIVNVDTMTIPKGDSTPTNGPIRDYVAHTGNGVALGSLRLSKDTHFIDFLGDDPQGAMIRERYQKEGLNFTSALAPNGTPRAVNFVDKTGRRFSFYDGRHPGNLRLPVDLYKPHLDTADAIHVSIANVCRDVFDHIAPGLSIVSTDLHSWDGEAEHHKVFALNSDIVFLSTENIRDRIESVMRWILDNGRAKIVVGTAGADGGWVLTTTKFFQYTAINPTGAGLGPDWKRWEAVDTNGAGDAFVSGFLWALREKLDLATAINAGALAGAWTVATPGTHTSFISRPLLLDSLKRLG